MKPVPPAVLAAANEKSRRLREFIRAPEILVMPGAHDVLSALLFEGLGFAAIQGSSAAIAWTLGFPDGEVIGRERAVQVTHEMAAAVSVPVNADGEAGYGGTDEAGETVRAFVAAGAAGMNLEDSARGATRTLVDLPPQLDKIAAVMAAKRKLGSEFFLNARTDAMAIMAADPKAALAEAVRRGNAYAEAGADCIFVLNPGGRQTIRRLVKEIAAPVSVFATADTPDVPELQELGVARVSYGSAFLRAALAGLKRFSEAILRGEHAAMREAMTGAEVAELLRRRLG
jgi:2-methylisocitrate lyase-like PEP mutase family enzyme